MIDYAEDAPKVTQQSLSLVTRKAQALLNAQDEIRIIEARLSVLKDAARRIEEQELPEAMALANLKEFKLNDGSRITVTDVIAGSPSKGNLEGALAWLRGHGHDGIIKRSISLTVRLPKGQDKEGNKLVRYLTRLKTLQNLGITPKDEPTIHYQTFGAWARELHAEHVEKHLAEAHLSEDCPFCNEERTKLLGIYIGKKAEITVPKEKGKL